MADARFENRQNRVRRFTSEQGGTASRREIMRRFRQNATGTYLTLGHDHASAALGHSGEARTMIYVDRDAQMQAQMNLAAEVARKVG